MEAEPRGWLARVAAFVPAPVRWLVRNEVDLVHTLWLVLRRTTVAPPGARVFPYGADQAAVFGVIAVLTLVEIVPVHFLVPWPWLRVTLLVLGAYGFLWAVGYYQGWRRHPHHVVDGDLVLRSGPGASVTVPVDAVTRTGRTRTSWDRRGIRVQDDGALTVTPTGETTAWLETADRWEVEVAGEVLRGPTVHLAADDPDALLAAVSPR